jgi:nitric oxide reductase subunit C
MKVTVYISLFAIYSVYSIVVYFFSATGIPAMDEKAAIGKQLWREKNCISCHQLYGLGGYMGPDLTNVTRQRDEAVVRTFVKYGGGGMPNLNLNDEEVDGMMEFLKYSAETGDYPLKNWRVTMHGSIILHKENEE